MTSEPIDPNDIEALRRRIAELEAAQHASVIGSGAVAQGHGDALGQRSVKVKGSSTGAINTGTQTAIATQGGAVVQGAVQVGNGHFIGRDFIQTITQVTNPSEDPEESKSVIALYLHALAADLAGLRMGEIDASADQAGRTSLQLADIYVPLDTTHHIAEDETLEHSLSAKQHRKRGALEEHRVTRPVSALEALAHHRVLTVLGKPGSGKSTFGASVLLTLAQAWQGHSDEIAKLGTTWKHGALLPIRVVLRRFAEQLPPGDRPARAGDLWAFIARDLEASGYGLSPKATEYMQRIARKDGALILLDGLDECGDGTRRGRVLAAVQDLQRSAGQACRFLLTARPYAWPDGPDPARGVYALADLNDEQIEQFIRAWYSALVARNWRSPGEADRKLEDLLQVRGRPDLQPLASNPLLLTLMATLHTNRGRLPDDRADLYNDSVDLLMLRWNREIGADKALLDALAVPHLKLSELREALEELAFKVHAENAGLDGTADIGEDRLVRAFRPLLNNSKDKADVVVEYIENRAGLLIGQGEKNGERQFTFPHRTFQEFLAACHLAAQEDFPSECKRLACAAPGHWQVVLPLAARLAKAERGMSAADELIDSKSVDQFRETREPTEEDWTCAWLAGMQLQELGAGAVQKSTRTSEIAKRVRGWLAASLPVHPADNGARAAQRALAGDVLAVLGDPRFDPQRLHLSNDPMLGFVRVPADPEFRIGIRKADAKRVSKIVGHKIDDEINDAPTPTAAFYIARYPVTVAQFRAFVEATRFQIGDANALRDPDTRPVRYVSWHEALAYCDWLTDQLSKSPVFVKGEIAHLVRKSGWCVSLPSELEWEKAARGTIQHAVFPWGDEPDLERANYPGTNINATSAVGCFPANSLGLHDMSGNVYEWTRTQDEPYPYRKDDGRENLNKGVYGDRVLRGGAWGSSSDYARCASRRRVRPDGRLDILGFRVVLRAAPVR